MSVPGCHARDVAEWSASLHRVSFTDHDFQASFAIEPEDFCFRCHAPLAKIRPEIVCGSPKEERVLHVDVATGKVQ